MNLSKINSMNSNIKEHKAKNFNEVWKELMDIWFCLFSKNEFDHSRYVRLVSLVQKTNDINILKALLAFNDIKENVDLNSRYEWLTSNLSGRYYPPISNETAGFMLWNASNNEKQYTKLQCQEYPSSSIIKADNIDIIKQNPFINDCSLIVSLINIRRQFPSILRVTSKENIFQVNLFFNGSNRLVTLDDVMVRANTYGEQLTVYSSKLDEKLIEQAYFQVKFNNCYGKGGSNVAIDTYLLTNFIPEILSTSECDIELLMKYYSKKCTIALGTSLKLDSDMKLRSNHDYSVSKISDNNYFELIDPLFPESSLYYTWEEVKKYFKSIYINWNPMNKYSSHKRCYFKYNSVISNKFETWTDKPIFYLYNTSETVQKMHILLERHLFSDPLDDKFCLIFEIPSTGFFTDYKKGNNTGFYLIELTLIPKEKKYFAIHSDITINYTLHLYSHNNSIDIKRGKVQNLYSVESFWLSSNVFGKLDTPTYFKNPSYSIIAESTSMTTNEIYVDIELVSQYYKSINFQLFYYDDVDFEKPILHDTLYYDKIMIYHGINILPKTKYIIVCSTITHDSINDFKLSIRPHSKYVNLIINPITLEFGGLRYHYKKNVEWQNKLIKMKIHINLVHPSHLHIYIYPTNDLCDERLNPIRCKIYITETKEYLINHSLFRSLAKRGYLIPNFYASNKEIVLFIEREITFDRYHNTELQIDIGSDFKVNVS